MIKKTQDQRLMLKVSHLYYNQKKSKSDIAKQLNLSRPTVQKLLDNAIKAGIVTIEVRDLTGRKYYPLEQELEEIFSLDEVYITENGIENVGKAGADLLDRLLEDNSIVGLSLGTSLFNISKHLNEGFYPNARFIPLVGGLGNIPQEIQGNSLAEKFAKNYYAQSSAFYSPARITNQNLLLDMYKEKGVKEVLDLSEKMDIALVGIGGINADSTLQQTGYISSQAHEDLKDSGICGDICMQFYDINGNTDQVELNKEILTINLPSLRNVKHSIGVCLGDYKTLSIIGAINGGYINTLITDISTAQKLKTQKDLFNKINLK